MARAPDPNLPRPKRGCGRRFPFYVRKHDDRNVANQHVNRVMTNVEPMIYKTIRMKASSILNEDEVQEVAQQCRIWLWERSLPSYDAYRGVRVSTFLYRCISNFVNQELRAIGRRRTADRHFLVSDPDLAMHVRQASDTQQDDAILHTAQDVIANPERYLTASQVVVFRALQANPRKQMKDLAIELGYRRASSLSMMMRRIRTRIAEIDLDDQGDPNDAA